MQRLLAVLPGDKVKRIMSNSGGREKAGEYEVHVCVFTKNKFEIGHSGILLYLVVISYSISIGMCI
jgi:hypothetical protein